jgi:hypothetical protein
MHRAAVPARGGAACLRKALKNGRCLNHGGLSTVRVPMSAIPLGFAAKYARARPHASWGLEMKTDNDWIERLIAARLAEHDERVRMRRASKAARGAHWQAIKVARGRASEERARLRELRNKPCGARTRAGHPCQRKGLGKGGRCPNHGGMSTGPRTPEGRARISASLAARWAARRAAAATAPETEKATADA